MTIDYNCDPCTDKNCENLILTDDKLYKRFLARILCSIKGILSGGSGAPAANVNVTASVLPVGAATETTLASIDSKITACNTGAVVVTTMPSLTVSSSALPTGAATSALQVTGNASLSTIAGDTTSIDGKITACNTGAVVVSSSALPAGAATEATLASIDGNITTCDTTDVTITSMPAVSITGSADSHLYGYEQDTPAWEYVRVTDNKLRVINQTYLQSVAEGDITNHTPWSKIGYTAAMTTTESDLWSAGGVYTFSPTAQQMEVLSSNNADDIGTVIHSGAATTTITATSVTVAGENFLTTTAAGDCVIISKSGTTPAWGYVTAIVSNDEITIGGGWSTGTAPANGPYEVIDKSATLGAHVVKIEYLDGSYAEKSEIVVLNGTTEVPTVNTDLFRINSFRVIAAGGNAKPTGNISLRETDNTPTYSYITAGFTRARNVQYTVPAGKALYITQILMSYGYSTNQTHFARIYTRANLEPSTRFQTGSLFYPYSEATLSNSDVVIPLECPTYLPAKTDIKVSGISTFTGTSTVVLRGWLETA